MNNRKFPIFSLILLLILVFGVWLSVRSVRSYINEREQKRQQALQNQNKVEELSITILEGWTINDIAAYLDKKKIVSSSDFLAASEKVDYKTYPFLSIIPEGFSLEGFLFPDTYRILKGATSQQIIDRLLANFEKKYTAATEDGELQNGRYKIPGYPGVASGDKQGLSPFEIVTLASIIEKEASSNGSPEALLDERKTIAGIFYNRLTSGQALQSDATINYVTGAGRPSPTDEDLQTPSPYNTYRNSGLPPGPISNPSLASLKAVLEPKKTDYYYFLHKQPSGEVVYSKTFEEHVQNKFRYLK